MTTEIAVLNRLGVALAADSAVTITRGADSKVYNTADKLFELSARHPVGLMVNGSLDCLGVPWEILAKDFRQNAGDVQRASIERWRDDFVAFVEASALLGDKSESRFMRAIAEREALELSTEISRTVVNSILKSVTAGTPVAPPVRDTILSAISRRTKSLEGVPQATSHGGFDDQDVLSKYMTTIQEVIASPAFGALGGGRINGVSEAFANLVAKRALSSRLGSTATGLVIAGYGEKPFPAMGVLEVEGRLLGRMKLVTKPIEQIDHERERGRIQFFAQTDVIERLLGGVDPRFVKKTADYMRRAVEEALEREVPTSRGRGVKSRKRRITTLAKNIGQVYVDEAVPRLKQELNKEFELMIAMMPKHDLLEFAEALVSITAVERKATNDIGTVGGPVDVAMITRHEGFVWVKRKHYFDAALNPRYFWRQYGKSLGGVRNEAKEE